MDFLIETLLILILIISFVFIFTIGIVFWYVTFPILIIFSIIRTFNRTQEQYKYDLKYWIESLNILDFILIISYIVSLGLYFISYDTRHLSLYINIGTFIGFIFNSAYKKDYFIRKSKFALSYVDFNESNRFIIGKINDIIKYDLYPDDLELLNKIKFNDVKINKYDEDENLKESIYRLTKCKFIEKINIEQYSYELKINNEINQYLDNPKVLFQLNVNKGAL